MVLPDGIEQEILKYLHLEYGEDPNDPSSLKLGDISYDGEYEIDGIKMHYFTYPLHDGRSWVSIEPYGGSYLISMTTNAPRPTTHKEIYRNLHAECEDQGFSKKIPMETLAEGCLGLNDYQLLTLPDDTNIHIFAEVNTNILPVGITVAVKEGDKEIYIRTSLGLI